MTMTGVSPLWAQIVDSAVAIVEDHLYPLRELVNETALQQFSYSAADDVDVAIQSLTAWKDEGHSLMTKGEEMAWKALFTARQYTLIANYTETMKNIHSATINSIDMVSRLTTVNTVSTFFERRRV